MKIILDIDDTAVKTQTEYTDMTDSLERLLDPEMVQGSEVIESALSHPDHTVLFLSARFEQARALTLAQLGRAWRSFDPTRHRVLLREDHSPLRAPEYKVRALRTILDDVGEEALLLDDNEENRRAFHESFPNVLVFAPHDGFAHLRALLHPPLPSLRVENDTPLDTLDLSALDAVSHEGSPDDIDLAARMIEMEALRERALLDPSDPRFVDAYLDAEATLDDLS